MLMLAILNPYPIPITHLSASPPSPALPMLPLATLPLQLLHHRPITSIGYPRSHTQTLPNLPILLVLSIREQAFDSMEQAFGAIL